MRSVVTVESWGLDMQPIETALSAVDGVRIAQTARQVNNVHALAKSILGSQVNLRDLRSATAPRGLRDLVFTRSHNKIEKKTIIYFKTSF